MQLSSAIPALVLALSLAGCSVGLDYFPEAAPTPTKYKELERLEICHAARLGRSRRLVEPLSRSKARLPAQAGGNLEPDGGRGGGELRAGARPHPPSASGAVSYSVGDYTYTRTRTGPAALGASGGGGGGGAGTTTFVPQFSGTWDLDVWGKVRRQIRAIRPARKPAPPISRQCQRSAQGALAIAYFNLRAADALRELLERGTVKEYKTTLEIIHKPVQQRVCGIEGR